jgi:hypothetical protein
MKQGVKVQGKVEEQPEGLTALLQTVKRIEVIVDSTKEQVDVLKREISNIYRKWIKIHKLFYDIFSELLFFLKKVYKN